jgi:sialate O-acetylesterase
VRCFLPRFVFSAPPLRGTGLVVLLLALASAAYADVSLPAIFSHHAVLQRGARVPVWGKASPHEAVSVAVAGVTGSTRADAAGRWRVALDLAESRPGPHELVVTGHNRLVVSDVVLGEVWLASGQSNMEWMLSGADDAAVEIARPANPLLRQFTVKRAAAKTPQDDCVGSWSIAGPATSARFSAIAYHFGRRIQLETGGPVGMINASWGGTAIELWLSEAAIARDPALHLGQQRALEREPRFAAELAAYAESGRAWAEKHQRADREPPDLARFTGPSPAAAERWPKVVLPEGLAAAPLPKSGAIWLRRTVRVPARVETIGLERGFLLSIGAFAGFDRVYWNGVKIGESSWAKPPPAGGRRYAVPPALLQPGTEATVALRIFNPLDTGFALTVPEGAVFLADTADLRGAWEVTTEFALPTLTAEAVATYPRTAPRASTVASRMFNGLIAPLAGYALRGFIWYQGESNVGRAVQYAQTFPALIRDWREHWGGPELPFYFCQLANANTPPAQPGDSGWAELREAQTRTLAVPRTGQAVLIDLGEADDLHPRNKREPAERLARLALRHDYGRTVETSGPVFASATAEGAAMRIRFRSTSGGLVARPLPAAYRPRSTLPRTVPLVRRSPGGAVEGFALCGADRRWVWADAARIEGDTVIVSSPQVTAPVAVRYAWADNPTCNLCNGAGLPAAPFRTDDFPLSTARTLF